MNLLVDIIAILARAIVMLVIIQFVISLLFSFNVVNGSNRLVVQIYESIDKLLRPILDPIRRVMPDTGAIDFSPLVLLLGLQILITILASIA